MSAHKYDVLHQTKLPFKQFVKQKFIIWGYTAQDAHTSIINIPMTEKNIGCLGMAHHYASIQVAKWSSADDDTWAHHSMVSLLFCILKYVYMYTLQLIALDD